MSQQVLSPKLVSRVNDDHSYVTVDIDLPGVRAKDVRLQMHDDSLRVRASSGVMEYDTGYQFCCRVDARRARAVLSDGRVTVEVPFRSPFYLAKDEQVGNRVLRQRF